MSVVTPPVEERTKTNIIMLADFMRLIVEGLNKKGDDSIKPITVTIVKSVFSQMDPMDIVHTFVTCSCDYWLKIANKDIDFFLENSSSIFGQLEVSDVLNFKALFSEHKLTDEETVTIWKYFHTLVRQGTIFYREYPSSFTEKEIEQISKSILVLDEKGYIEDGILKKIK